MGQHALELLGIAIAQAGNQQGAGFEGRVPGIRQVEERELRARALAEPSLQERGNLGSCLRPELDIDFVVGRGPGGEIRSRMGLAMGNEEISNLMADFKMSSSPSSISL